MWGALENVGKWTGLDLKVGSGQGVRVCEQSGIYLKNLEGRTEGTETRQGKARLTEQRQERPTRSVYRQVPPSADTHAPRSLSVRAPEPNFFHPSIYLHTLRAQLRISLVDFIWLRLLDLSVSTFFLFLWGHSLSLRRCTDIARPSTFRYSFFTASFVIVLRNHEHIAPYRLAIYNQHF